MTSVKYDYSFLAGFYQDGILQFNNYNLHIHLYVNTESDVDQQTAFDRMNLVIYDLVDNSIFVEETDYDTIKKYQEAEFRVFTISDPGPIDQIVQVTLVDKLNAVTEDVLHIFESEFSSLRGGYVKYMYFSPESDNKEMELISSDPKKWWNDCAPRFTTINNSTEIVDFNCAKSWKDLELEWENDVDDVDAEPAEFNSKKTSNIITMKIPDES